LTGKAAQNRESAVSQQLLHYCKTGRCSTRSSRTGWAPTAPTACPGPRPA